MNTAGFKSEFKGACSPLDATTHPQKLLRFHAHTELPNFHPTTSEFEARLSDLMATTSQKAWSAR